MMYIGIDPGKSGGIVFIDQDDGNVELYNMPDTEKDIFDLIYSTSEAESSFAVIEKVQGFIGNSHPGSAMFKFGQNYGGLRMALISSQIPFVEITPRTWQKELGIQVRKPKETKRLFKARIKAKAQQLYPSQSVTLATCDALLLAHYAKLTTR